MPLHAIERLGLGWIVRGDAVAQDDAPARPAHPHHLGERRLRPLEMVEREPAGDDVMARLGKGQRIDIAAMPFHIGKVLSRRQSARLIEHRRGGIEPDRATDMRRKCRHHGAGPAGDVEALLAGTRLRRFDHEGQHGVIVQRGRAGEVLGLPGELILDRGGVRLVHEG